MNIEKSTILIVEAFIVMELEENTQILYQIIFKQ